MPAYSWEVQQALERLTREVLQRLQSDEAETVIPWALKEAFLRTYRLVQEDASGWTRGPRA